MDASLITNYKQARDTVNAAVTRAWWISLLAAYFFVQLLVFPEYRNGPATAIIVPWAMHVISPIFTCGRGGIIECTFSFFHALTLGYTIAALHGRFLGQTADRVVEIFCLHTLLAHQILRENMFANLKGDLKIMYVFHRTAAAYRRQKGAAEPTIMRHVWQWYRQRLREALWNTVKRAGIQAAMLRWSIQQIYNDPELQNPPFRWLYVLALLVGLRYTLAGLWELKRVALPTLDYMFMVVLDLVELAIDGLMAVLP